MLIIQKKITFPVISLFFCLCIHGQIILEGVIRSNSGDVISFATVKFKPDSTGMAKKFCIASRDGFYTIILSKGIQKGFLEISAVGFTTRIIPVQFMEDKLYHVDISLYPIDQSLPEVFIKIDPSIEISGDTVSFKADAFKRGNESNLGNLLEKMPGFVIQENGKILFNGEPINNILIENDDLTGRNYELITKNLGITGIDKIQVIKNYNDPENIISPLNGSKKQVLNIRFKKKFQNKIFGNIEGNAGIPLENYKATAQTVSLVQKIKSINFGKTNSTGDINENVFQNNESKEEGDDLTEFTLDNNDPISNIADLQSNYTKNKLIYSNHSLLSSTNLSFNLSPKIKMKGFSNYQQDRYKQNATTLKTIFLPPQTITALQVQTINRNVKSFSNGISINYLISKKNQVAFTLKTVSSRMENQGSGILQNTSYNEANTGTENEYGCKVTYNHMLKNNSALIFTVQKQQNQIPNFYSQNPQNFDSFFLKNNTYLFLQQQERQKFSSVISSLAFVKKSKKNILIISLSGQKNYNTLLNKINLLNNFQSEYIINQDSTNNIKVNQQSVRLKLQNSWSYNKLLSFTFNTEILYQHYMLGKNDGSFNSSRLNKTLFLPGLSAKFRLSNLSQITASFTTQNTMPPIKNLGNGYIIGGLTSFMQGSDFLNTKLTYTARVFYSYIDIADKRILFFSGISYQKSPLLYLGNQFPNQYYTFLSYQATGHSINLVSFFSRADKFLSQAQSKISPEFSISKGRTYNLIESKESVTDFSQLKLGVGFNTNIKTIQINSGVHYISANQKNSALYSSKIRIRHLESSLTMDWKITRSAFFDFVCRDELMYSPDQRPKSFFSADTHITYHSKNEKWEYGLKCNNLFNQKLLSSTTLISTQIYSTSFRLFPRIFLAELKFKF